MSYKEAEPKRKIVRHQCAQTAISHLGGFEEIEMTMKGLNRWYDSDLIVSAYLQVLRHTHTYSNYKRT